MASSDREVTSFEFALEQARALIKIGTKRSNFYTGFWNGFTSRVANRLLEKPDISGVGSYERNIDGQALSVVVVCPVQRIVYDHME